ncbi:MAG TPA: hypothetical protein VI136_18545, partial [Verrucomicrobiae bacterium]
GAGGAGGGAIRLEVGGTLTLTGSIQANGNDGVGNNSGGGSGGSVFLVASNLTGTGTISAAGGKGKTQTVGGGGGGGRIAVCAFATPGFNPAAQIMAPGGAGYVAGDAGTVFVTNALAPLRIASHAPAGVAGSPLAHLDLTFSAAIQPKSFSGEDVAITRPGGVIPQEQITVRAVAGHAWRITFPSQPNQALEDVWQFRIGPDITGLLGQPMLSAYAFTLLVREITLTATASGDALRVTWPSGEGLQYQAQVSEDLRTWTNYGVPLHGDGGLLELEFPWTNAPRQFFRVKQP